MFDYHRKRRHTVIKLLLFAMFSIIIIILFQMNIIRILKITNIIWIIYFIIWAEVMQIRLRIRFVKIFHFLKWNFSQLLLLIIFFQLNLLNGISVSISRIMANSIQFINSFNKQIIIARGGLGKTFYFICFLLI